MRRILLLAYLLPAIGISQPIVGVYGGVNAMNFSGDTPEDGKYRSNNGYLYGLNIDFAITDEVLLSLQPGVNQVNVALAFRDMSSNKYVDSAELKLSHATLPVMVNIISNNQKWYFTSGIEVGYLTGSRAVVDGSEIDLSSSSNNLSLSLNFGILRKIPLGVPFAFIGVRYAQGLTNITNDPIHGYVPRIKTSGLQLRVGMQYPLKQKEK